ncbi:hypothetical protein GCM10010975_27760 [Comamonas phosphati]|nr:hypothetical protein GCM10010975_27760 [Comamonas phosphati]
MRYSHELLLSDLFRLLENSPLCSSVEQAHELLASAWLAVNQQRKAPEAQLRYLRRRKLIAEHGWRDLDGDPCYRQIDEAPDIRINLHRNGAIVFERRAEDSSTVLFVQPGSQAP